MTMPVWARTRVFFISIFALFSVVTAWAQFPDPYLTDENRPDGTKWLPDPPSMVGGEFANDFYFYQWGKTQREGIIGEQALWDESAELYQVFSDAMGITLSYSDTPEILLLAEASTSDAYAANKKAKNYYQRRRPFVKFNEPSLKPEEDETEALEYSYPSGHSSRGWMFALVLSTVAPEKTEMLMERGRQYAINRVICGHHWKSDIDASLMLIAGIFANVVVTEAYQQQLVKARAEYKSIIDGATGITTPQRTAESHETAVYDLQGRRLTGKPANDRIYITDGKKVINH